MSEIRSYYIGSRITLWVEFTDEQGVYVDPGSVRFSYRKPLSSGVTTLIYGTHGELVKDTTGKYHVELYADVAGDWHYRWFSTGTRITADEGYFRILPSQLS